MAVVSKCMLVICKCTKWSAGQNGQIFVSLVSRVTVQGIFGAKCQVTADEQSIKEKPGIVLERTKQGFFHKFKIMSERTIKQA